MCVYIQRYIVTGKHACIHLYMSGYTNAYTYTSYIQHTDACLLIYKHIYMHVTYMHVCIHTSMYACIHTKIPNIDSWMFASRYICAYIYTYRYTYICMDIHVGMHGLYTDRQTLMFVQTCMHTSITHTFQLKKHT